MPRLFLLLLLLCCLPAAAGTSQAFVALCYHDVLDTLDGPDAGDRFAVTTQALAGQLEWLRVHGYHPVSLAAIRAAGAGGPPLPDKAVLLTFDDGYASVYTRVFPLLRSFGYPALLGPVGRWTEQGRLLDEKAANDSIDGRKRLASWPQLQEMIDSGLVEVASHSYDLHQGILANPQGNLEPAATSFAWRAEAFRYETLTEYRTRVGADLRASADLIRQRLGHAPQALIWPYGAHSGEADELAAQAGLATVLTLGSGYNDGLDLQHISRALVYGNPAIDGFADLLRPLEPASEPAGLQQMRVVQVDLDYVYDPDPAQQGRNLDALLDRIKAMGVNTVFLQAYADPAGKGGATALYFPNRHLPMRADLFNRVAWQLRTRAGVKVYAWMPVLAFAVPDAPADWYVQDARTPSPPDPGATDKGRLSPFRPEVRALIGDLYEDLARYAQFDGLLFHDDGYLGDFEDVSPAARAVYTDDWHLPTDLAALRRDPAQARRFAGLKTRYLADFTHQLSDRVRRFRGDLRTARNLYARVVTEPDSEAWFAQSYAGLADDYDYLALMAMPYMEGASDPERWLATLVTQARATPKAYARTIFELQSVDWRQRPATPVAVPTLVRQMRTLLRSGVTRFGYYPDDFIHDRPALDALLPGMSLQTDPFAGR